MSQAWIQTLNPDLYFLGEITLTLFLKQNSLVFLQRFNAIQAEELMKILNQNAQMRAYYKGSILIPQMSCMM